MDTNTFNNLISQTWPDLHAASTLGGGTFGTVYACTKTDAVTGVTQKEAVKVVRVDFTPEDRANAEEEGIPFADYYRAVKEKRLQEIRWMVALKSPHIVHINGYTAIEEPDHSALYILIRMDCLTALDQLRPAHLDDTPEQAAALAESWSKHPISLSIKAAYGKEIDTSRVTDVEELGGHGVTAKVDGKPVAAGNARLMERLGLSAPAVSETGTVVHVAIDGRYAGCLLIADVVKPHSAEAIRALKAAGVRKTVMLTGDAEPVAKAVSAQLGLDEYHAGLLPGDKVDQIETLIAAKKSKENLAFVGDGINDAPVLSRADVGIAMGALGSDAAIEAADVVLMDDDPAKIALAMRIARRTLRIVYENIVFALAVKFACLLLGAIGMASMWTAIFADVGVMVIAVLNATRALYTKDLVKKSPVSYTHLRAHET